LHETKDSQVFDVSSMIVTNFRKVILHRAGAGGIAALGRTFRLMDRDHNESLSPSEMQIALKRFGLTMEEKDVQLLMSAVSKDNRSAVSYGDFLVALRGKLSKRRLQMIGLAFKVIDSTGDGQITIDDLGHYNTKFDPDVKSGKLTTEEALRHLLANFEQGDKDGIVTKDEFTTYYKNVSASIDDDDYFELMMRNAWHIPGGEGWCANTSNHRVLVTLADGEQKVVCIESDLGLDMNNQKAVMAALAKQGVKNVVEVSSKGSV